MFPIPSGVKVWVPIGHTDMRRGMQSLALSVQESLKRDPHLCVGRRYVAAPSGSEQFRGFGEFRRHIISDDSPPTQDRPGHRQRGVFDVGFVFQV
jgi:transposase